MSPIKGLSEKRVLPRLGKIHLGKKHAEKGYPMKTDYFVLPEDNPHYKALVKVFGAQPKELSILIPVEDEEKWASQYYRCYSKSKGLVCKGDGEIATRMTDKKIGGMADSGSEEVEMREVVCRGRDCPDYKIKCKEVMNLQFLLPEIPGLGVWQIDTGSINSIKNINSMAELIKSMYGRIHNIPLLLTLEPREVNNPQDGKKQTVYVLQLRTNMKLADLALATREQAEILSLEMPTGDAEPSDSSPEWDYEQPAPMTEKETAEAIKVGWPDTSIPKTVPPIKRGEYAEKPKPKDVDPATLEFTNAGAFYTACVFHFKLQKSAVDKEISMYNLADTKQRKAAWMQLVGTYRQPDAKG